MISMHVDLNIIDGDFVFNPSLSVEKLSAAKVVGQDVKHRILESGLLVKLVKQRNRNGIAPVLTDLELEVEQDDRLKPGTILITYNSDNTLSIEAQTKQYGLMKWAGA